MLILIDLPTKSGVIEWKWFTSWDDLFFSRLPVPQFGRDNAERTLREKNSLVKNGSCAVDWFIYFDWNEKLVNDDSRVFSSSKLQMKKKMRIFHSMEKENERKNEI